jgi:ubiquinone/menaquinone biosynthesis C-methylase UbiE
MSGPQRSSEPRSVADAYSRAGAAWETGPGVIYNRLAEVLLDACPVPIGGRRVLDVGAGTGAASRAAIAMGAEVCALDFAFGMLAYDLGTRPPAIVADAAVLPIRDAAVDVVVAAFSYNHLTEPEAGLREAARVLRPAGVVVASAYAEDDAHPARDAAEDALTAVGWSAPEVYAVMKRDAVPMLATEERAHAVTRAAGLTRIDVQRRRVAFPELSAEALVHWRLGMAHTAPFFGALGAAQQDSVVADAVARLEGAPPLVRSMVVIVAATASRRR